MQGMLNERDPLNKYVKYHICRVVSSRQNLQVRPSFIDRQNFLGVLLAGFASKSSCMVNSRYLLFLYQRGHVAPVSTLKSSISLIGIACHKEQHLRGLFKFSALVPPKWTTFHVGRKIS